MVLRRTQRTGGTSAPVPSFGRAWIGRVLRAGCVLVVCALAPAARAAQEAHAPFDGYYARMQRALEKRDLDAALAQHAARYVATARDGSRRTLPQLRADLAQAFRTFQSFQYGARLHRVQRSDRRADVTYQARLDAEVRDGAGNRRRIVIESEHRDAWEQQDGQWWLVASRTLSERNLSPAPQSAGPVRGPGGGGGFDVAAGDLAMKHAMACYQSQLREACDRLNRHVAHWMARCETQKTAHACNTANVVVDIDVRMRAASSRPRL